MWWLVFVAVIDAVLLWQLVKEWRQRQVRPKLPIVQTKVEAYRRLLETREITKDHATD